MLMTPVVDSPVDHPALDHPAVDHPALDQAALAALLSGAVEASPGGPDVGDDAERVHLHLTYSFTPWSCRVQLSDPFVPRAAAPRHLVGGTLAFQLHRDDEADEMVPAAAQVTFFAESSGQDIQLDHVQGMDESAAWAVPFVNGWLQAGGFAQILGGAALRSRMVVGQMRVAAEAPRSSGSTSSGRRARIVASRWALRPAPAA
jgi:hypothetical protein